MKKIFGYPLLLFYVLYFFTGCNENTSKIEANPILKIFPLSPYQWRKDNNCAKFFILEKGKEDSLDLVKKLISFIDSSSGTKQLITLCDQAHFIFYATSNGFDTSFRETKQTSLSAHSSDLLGMGTYLHGRILHFEFYQKEKTVFFNFDSIGKLNSTREFKK